MVWKQLCVVVSEVFANCTLTEDDVIQQSGNFYRYDKRLALQANDPLGEHVNCVPRNVVNDKFCKTPEDLSELPVESGLHLTVYPGAFFVSDTAVLSAVLYVRFFVFSVVTVCDHAPNAYACGSSQGKQRSKTSVSSPLLCMATPHLAATCMFLLSTSSGLLGEPATESHTSVSATMSYNEGYNVCSENATIYCALQGDRCICFDTYVRSSVDQRERAVPRVLVSNMLRSTTICFDYQNKLKLSQSSCPDGMRLASHDPVCDPSLRKWVMRQRCYPIKCFNVLHIQHMEVQSLCNERQEHDGCHSIHCAPSE